MAYDEQLARVEKRLEHAHAQVGVLRIAVVEAVQHIENMRIIPGGVRDKLCKRLRAALEATHFSTGGEG